MELLNDLTGSLFWATLLSILLYTASSIAIGFLARKSTLLKPNGAGLKLIALFFAVQVFLHLGAAEYHPRVSMQLNFFSWLVFTFAAIRLGLYLYGDLFVVRWKRGSFPAAFKNIITSAVIVVVALILLKEILDINVTSLIATTTVLTATIGLAFQSTLANMLAGFTIHLEKPLKQGDWISAGGHEGRVVDITLRSTRIRTLDNNEVFIPNSKVLNENVVNYSLPDSTIMRNLTVGVSYAVQPNKVKKAVLDVLATVPGVAKLPPPRIRVVSYGDFTVNYEIRYPLVSFASHGETEAEIMNLIWYCFRRNGIEIPFPVRDVNVRHVTPESLQSERDRQTADLINMMEKVEILSPLSGQELKELVACVSVKSYAAGEVPVHQGDPGDSFYIIKTGKVDVVVEKSPGESAVVATLNPGNIFGEMSLLTGEKRAATVRAIEDSLLILIDKALFAEVMSSKPEIVSFLADLLAKRQGELQAHVGTSARALNVVNSFKDRIKAFFDIR